MRKIVAQLRRRLLHLGQTTGIFINDYIVMVPGPPGEYYNNYKYVGDLILNMKLMPPFHSTSENTHIIASQTLQPLASYCIQATPALRGHRALAREARRPTRGTHKKKQSV